MYEGIEYQVVKDDGSDIIIAVELQDDFMSKDNVVGHIDNTRKFTITELKSKMSNPNEWACWLR